MTLHPYLPQDRLRAISRGESLPDHTTGAAIFADISGFTRLTETLRDSLGARRGAEELARILDEVLTALINVVEKYGGSVISFAGDSITCWFDETHSPASPRSVACAFEMQQVAMSFKAISLTDGTTSSLFVKVGVASGPARRFIVGDPCTRCMDALAGPTVARTSSAEHLAQKGEVLVDETTINLLSSALTVVEWRSDPETGERFAVAGHFTGDSVGRVAIEQVPSMEDEKLRTWVHRSVYEREQSGQAFLLTEFRPCVALFLRFSGIDYESDEAGERLDAVICKVQAIVTSYGGTLLQIIIGDKGSYLYINLGALNAHEDDASRSVKIALELRDELQTQGYLTEVCMGITQGLMLAGAFGAPTRRDYVALGDDVNLAARLMQTAAAGEILLSRNVQKAAGSLFIFEPRPPLSMKGKAEPLPVFAVTGTLTQRATRLPEPTYRLPMIGRQVELKSIDEKLSLAQENKGQVIGIIAEAGMGKSRLIAEIIRLARKRGFSGYGGACQSIGRNMPYQVWQQIWQAFFDLDLEIPQRKQIRILEGEIEDRAPDRMNALPLLGLVLDLALPENDFTRALEPKDRKNSLEALLEDCIKSAAGETPLLIVIEDYHWIDPLSNELLENLARISTSLAVCFVLAYRPPDSLRYLAPQIESLPQFTRIELGNLNSPEAEQLIRSKLAQLFPEWTGALPKNLVVEITSRSQGNPFFIEEMLNYLHDRGLNPTNANTLATFDLPSSLQKLILSRVDQLTEPQKIILKAASVIGRVFPFEWLHGYYPSLGDEVSIKANLVELSNADLMHPDTPEPDLSYLFKHFITQEVAYESLSYATRARLHELLANYLEATFQDNLPIDTLAYHYGRSNNQNKKLEYLHKSGDAALAAFSNAAALESFVQALSSSPGEDESITLHLKTGEILQLTGRPDEALAHYQSALHIATTNALVSRLIECEIKIGNLWILHGDYPQAIEWLEKVHALAIQLDDLTGTCDALNELGVANWRLAKFETARQYLQEGVRIAQQLGDKKRESTALTVLGHISGQIGNFSEGYEFFRTALSLARELNDKKRISGILTNYGTTFYYEGRYEEAKKMMEEGLAAAREIGDKRVTAITLNNLGNIFYLKNDFETARKYYEEALGLGREAADKYTKSIALSSLGITAFRQGKFTDADLYYQEGLGLTRELGDQVGLSLLYCYLGLLALKQDQPLKARRVFIEGLTIAHQKDIKPYIIYNFIGMASVFIAEDLAHQAVITLSAASEIIESTRFKVEPELQEPYEKTLAIAKAKMSQTGFDSSWAEGKEMTLETAVQFLINAK